MRDILDTSPIGLAIVSTKSKERMFANQKLVEMFGAASADELLRRNIKDSWVDSERFLQADEIMSAGENLVDFRAQRLRLDGTRWWVLMNSHFTTFEDERARVIWHYDITETVESKAAIERAYDELEARVEARTAEIQQTEKKFRDFAEVASDWFWEMDADLKYTFVSEAYEKVTLKPPAVLIGRSRREMYAGQFPEERDNWLEFLDTLDKHLGFDTFIYSYTRSDGTVLTLSTSGRPVFDEAGTFTGYRGIGVDYSEQHKLRNQVSDQQAQLLAFTQFSTSPVTIIGVDGRYKLVNEIVCKNLGLDREQIIGKTIDDIYPPDTGNLVKSQNQEVLAGRQSKNFEFSMTYADGLVHTFLTERFPILSADNKITGVGSVSSDITDRKRVEEQLHISETRFKMVVDMQNDLITRFSPDWKLTFVNRAYCEFVNDTEKNLVGASMFDDVPDDVTGQLVAYFNTFTPENSVQRNENQLMRHDGELRDLEWSNFAQFDESGNVQMYQSVGRDVTEQRQAQLEIILANEKAQEANRAKSNFLSTMSHEIRTPLNGVLGLAQLLIDTNLDRDQLNKVETILSSGQTLLSIINDVLDMSKIEAGGLELEDTAFGLRDLISVITTPFQSLANEKGLSLKVSDTIERGLVLKGDQIRLRQILWNLLSNSIKFTDHGGVTLSIVQAEHSEDLQVEKRDLILRFVVEDTGPGITPDRLAAIFDAFTQEDNSITRKFGGTGLGLSIVKQLTEMMGGTIAVVSEVGKGAQFSVVLPFFRASLAEVEKITMAIKPSAIEHGLSLKILVAEDNPVNAMIAKSFLEKFGHEVRHVENGALAVSAASENWANLILMDIHMPEMDGIEATQIIRKSGATQETLPIIGLTAEAFFERHTQFKEAGMNDVLTKPFTERQLAEILHQYGWPTVQKPAVPTSSPEQDQTEDACVDTDSLPIIDERQFSNFCNQVTPEIVMNLLTKAEESLIQNLEGLRDGIETANPEKIYQAAHAIKGSSGSMFAARLADLARIVEQNSNEIANVQSLMPKIVQAANETIQWWQNRAI